MFNVGAALRVGSLISLGFLASAGSSITHAQTASFVAPPRNISDITAILDQQKPDPSRAARNKAAADAAPPASGALGQFYYQRGQARAALGRSEEAIADVKQAISLGGDFQTEVSRYMQFMAQQYRVTGNAKSAIEIEQAIAKKVEEQGRGKGLLFGVNLRIISSYLTLGDVKQAESYLAKNQALLNESKSWQNVDLFRSSWEANVEYGRARVLQARGNYRDAELAFRKAQTLQRDAITKSPKWPSRPATDIMESSIDFMLNYEGQSKARQGRLNEAEADIRRALLSRLKTVGKYHPDIAQITNSLAGLLSEQARFGEAEQLARTSVDIYQALGAPEESTIHAFALNQLAATLYSQRKYDDAAAIYDRLDAATRNWEPSRAARLRLGFARIYTSYVAKRTDQGIELARQLVDRETRRVGDKHVDSAMANAILGAGLTFARRDADAFVAYRKALPILLAASRDDADDSTVSAAADNRMQVVIESYLILLSRNRGSVADVGVESFQLGELIRGRSVERALSASSARAVARDPALAELVRKEQDLEKQIVAELGALNNMLAAAPEERSEKELAALRTEIEKLRTQRTAARRDIARRFPGYADLVTPKPAGVEDIRATLRPDEAFVSFHLGRGASFVWAVPKQGPVAFAYVAANAADINKRVQRLREALEPQAATIADIPPYDLQLAHELYALLLRPVEAAWKPAKQLIVVTTGALGLLPLSLLPTAPVELKTDAAAPIFAGYRDVPWLARTHAVTLVPSAAALRTLRGLPRGSDKREPMIGFGDPVFSPRQAAGAKNPQTSPETGPQAGTQLAEATTRGLPLSRRASPQTRNVENAELALLPRLPDTAAELTSIALALQSDPTKVLSLGTAANEEMVKKANLSKFRIIVFATHGLVPGDLEGLTQPALALSAPTVSGTPGDGLLTMEEILALKLDADWVVLSACNTGAAAGAGAEAASGLGRAFFYAGTRAILVTNWSVHSASARELVTDLFRRQSADRKITRGEAMRQAMLALQDGPGFVDAQGKSAFTYAHPLFWAPYSIIGDGGGAQN
jgi:CHAT domain-containing protein